VTSALPTPVHFTLRQADAHKVQKGRRMKSLNTTLHSTN
jgi:hypothetical protein